MSVVWYDLSDLPKGRGTYVLLMRLPAPAWVQVGRLGVYNVPAGVYAYVGSAHGPGGVAARVGRHLRSQKRTHWHIDYLLELVQVSEVWGTFSVERLECLWASQLLQMDGGRVVIPRFGASDCSCATHLVHWDELPATSALHESLGIQWGIRTPDV